MVSLCAEAALLKLARGELTSPVLFMFAHGKCSDAGVDVPLPGYLPTTAGLAKPAAFSSNSAYTSNSLATTPSGIPAPTNSTAVASATLTPTTKQPSVGVVVFKEYNVFGAALLLLVAIASFL